MGSHEKTDSVRREDHEDVVERLKKLEEDVIMLDNKLNSIAVSLVIQQESQDNTWRHEWDAALANANDQDKHV